MGSEVQPRRSTICQEVPQGVFLKGAPRPVCLSRRLVSLCLQVKFPQPGTPCLLVCLGTPTPLQVPDQGPKSGHWHEFQCTQCGGFPGIGPALWPPSQLSCASHFTQVGTRAYPWTHTQAHVHIQHTQKLILTFAKIPSEFLGKIKLCLWLEFLSEHSSAGLDVRG